MFTPTATYAPSSKCKILLPEFSTCEQVNPGRKNGARLPFCNIAGVFSANDFCRYAHIASPFKRKADAI